MDQKRRIIFNSFSNLLLNMVTIGSSVIVPAFIIRSYGSDVNGLLASITQFLGYISLIEGGVGGVVKAALYKPLAYHNEKKVGGIMKATQHFFSKVALIMVIYIMALAVAYPLLKETKFSFFEVATLVVILGIGTAAQYFIGMPYILLLQAQHKGYVVDSVNIICLLLNAVATIALIYMSASIHVVKLFSAVVFIIRPIVVSRYAKKTCQIDLSVPEDKHALSQRWDGFGQHIAYFIHTNTDVALLTCFSNLYEVSVYTVYKTVVSGIRSVIYTLSNGISAALGNMVAREEKDHLRKTFEVYEFISYVLTTVAFTVTGLLMLPFVTMYTAGTSDVNYIRPAFSVLMIAAEALYCYRFPATTLVTSAGHYKQTSKGAYVEAVINIVLSLALVKPFGIVGVAAGTVGAMLYRTVDIYIYASKHMLSRSIKKFVWSMSTQVVICVIGSLLCSAVTIVAPYTVIGWVIQAIIYVVVMVLVSICVCGIMERETLKLVMRIGKKCVVRHN